MDKCWDRQKCRHLDGQDWLHIIAAAIPADMITEREINMIKNHLMNGSMQASPYIIHMFKWRRV